MISPGGLKMKFKKSDRGYSVKQSMCCTKAKVLQQNYKSKETGERAREMAKRIRTNVIFLSRKEQYLEVLLVFAKLIGLEMTYGTWYYITLDSNIDKSFISNVVR